MKSAITASVFWLVLGLPALAFVPPPVQGAPGPIVGAGLPVFAVGYGVYWLIKRRRKAG